MGGRIMADVASATYAVGLPKRSAQTEMNPLYYTPDNTTVVALVFLCAFISLLGFFSILPWNYIWRSHERLMAARLANTGLKKKAIKALPCIVYSKMRSEPNVAECPVCLAEFMEGENLRVLPKCKHSFHLECVDKWLLSHSSCPTCRHCLLQKQARVAEDHVIQCGSNQILANRSETCVLEQIDVPRARARARADQEDEDIVSVWESSDIECGLKP